MIEGLGHWQKNITFPINVHSQHSDVHADTRLVFRRRRDAHTGARFSVKDRAQSGASGKMMCEDKIRVIAALQ